MVSRVDDEVEKEMNLQVEVGLAWSEYTLGS